MDELLVGLNEYRALNKDNPIGYVRDIHSCVGCLIHRQNDVVMMHIEAYKDSIELANYINILETSNDVKKIELFKGKETSSGNLSILKFIAHRLNIECLIYDIFTNLSNETSLGYDYNTNTYYSVTMDMGKPLMKKKTF